MADRKDAQGVSKFIAWFYLNAPDCRPWLSEECDKLADLLGYWMYVKLRETIDSPVETDAIIEMAKEMFHKKLYLTSAFLFAKAGRASEAEAAFNLHDGYGCMPNTQEVRRMIDLLKAKEVIGI